MLKLLQKNEPPAYKVPQKNGRRQFFLGRCVVILRIDGKILPLKPLF